VAELRYCAWGETRYTYGTTPTTYRFTGQREDATIGLYFYNARYYDPVLGRFVQADTIVPEPGNPQALNRYAYVNNNPLKYTDPSGHWLETVWDIANIVWDIHEIRQDPGNLWNWGALVVDVGAALLPVVPAGAGVVVHGGKAAKAAAEAVSHGDEVVDAGRAVAKAAGHADDAADAARRGDEGPRVLFGQARVDPTFSNKPDVPTHLKGRQLEEVAADLRAGVLQPKDIPIQAFEYQGQLVAANNRGLTTLSMAGMKPTNIIIRSPTRSELKRLSEISVLGDRLPSTRIAITPHRTDHRILRVVHVPE
jgi:RHS repeat-associated protein